jgi:beta-lactamase regulating signal transducer with metallopeptidase domain/DUF4097 and DUF4098 domain-containing protein YvlB
MTHLLNSLWQGTALTLIVWLLLKLLPNLSSATRYFVWWITMFAVLLLPLTPPISHQPSSNEAPLVTSTSDTRLTIAPSTEQQLPITLSRTPFASATEPRLAIIESPAPHSLSLTLPSGPITRAVAAVWVILSVALLARLGYSYQALGRLKRTAFEPPDGLRVRFNQIVARTRLNRQPRLLISSEISTPLALGFIHPVVLFPSSLAEAPSADEFDQLCLHEIAHLSRFDDWANLFQHILIALMPMQPALFWIGRHLNLEREAACDDRVIAITAAPRPYAASLTRIAELALWPGSTALATGVASSRSQLYRRIHRLLDRRMNKRTSVAPIPLLSAIAVIVCLFTLSFSAPQLIALADAPPPSTQPSNPPANSIPDIAPQTLPPTPGTQTQSIPAQPGEKLAVDVDFGNIHITTWDQNTAQFKIIQKGSDVTKLLQHHHIQIGRKNHEVSLRASADSSFSPGDVEIQYEINVPRQFDLQLEDRAGNADLSNLTGSLTANIEVGNIDATDCAGELNATTRAGNITLHKLTASAHATVSDGNVEAHDCQSPLTLKTQAGNVDVTKISADVTADSDAGNVTATSVSGPLRAETKMGNAEIHRFTGSSLSASSRMGNVDADIDLTPKANCSLTTNMGNVDLNLVHTAAVILKFSSAMGNADSDFPAGPVNGGGPEILVSTRMGNISIHRK